MFHLVKLFLYIEIIYKEVLYLLTKLKYGQYTFNYNPSTLNISFACDILRHKYLFQEYSQSFSFAKKRIIYGEGEFVGESPFKEYNKFFDIIKFGGENLLIIDNANISFSAFLKEFVITSGFGTKRLKYKFTFEEK